MAGGDEEQQAADGGRADLPMTSADICENVQQALLCHGDLVLHRSRRGRSTPMIPAAMRRTCGAAGGFPWKWCAS